MKQDPEKNSSINGILLLNKSQGMSSNAALQKAKRSFNAKKAGHSGSLDPLATGMLPICFGEATKICFYLLEADKCYETTGLLGIKTNTADSTGEILAEKSDFNVSETDLKAVLEEYKGCTQQIPSMFSALKHKGTPLYKLARKGLEVERKARNISITQLDLNSYDGKAFSLTVCCTKGTYIRNLVEDIGEDLHVGAHVTQLHRVYTSGFQQLPMYTLEQIEAMSLEEKLECLIPMDKAIEHLPSLVLSDEDVQTIRHGLTVKVKSTFAVEFSEMSIRIYNEQLQFIGIGEMQMEGALKAKRLLAH